VAVLVTASRSDDELLTSGGPDGFALFYRRHVDSVLRYFARSTRNPDVAADLTAEAFAAALVAKRRFKPGGPPAQAWLFAIASRKLADYHRRGYAEDRARRRLGMERVEPSEDDLRRIEGLAGDVHVVSLLEELPADQRHAVGARVLDEREYEDIAGELSISPAAARQRVSRGLAFVRGRLKEGRP
jgi:RNA polymerase sigma-70 factor (ECF subfamily)